MSAPRLHGCAFILLNEIRPTDLLPRRRLAATLGHEHPRTWGEDEHMSMRILIADDQQLILNAIRSALQNEDEIEVVGATRRGADVLRLVDAERPDLVLLDHRMAETGVACIRRIKQSHPETKVVTLSASETPAEIADALEAGADAYIGKRINPEDLPSALRQVVGGVVHHAGPERAEAPAGPGRELAALTERELTMLEYISRGLSTKVISRELLISEKTVKFHLTNMYRKLGVHNRTSAMRYAYEHDLLPQAPRAGLALVAG
jgi:DNA-binding NarL/FixJ family response regulator